jgi:hypothetical protein
MIGVSTATSFGTTKNAELVEVPGTDRTGRVRARVDVQEPHRFVLRAAQTTQCAQSHGLVAAHEAADGACLGDGFGARAKLEDADGLDGGPVAEWRAVHHGYERLDPPAILAYLNSATNSAAAVKSSCKV